MKRELDFPKNLKLYRKKMGLTRKSLAQKLCYSEKSVEKWESGDAVPPLSIICELSEIFGISVDRLIYKEHQNIKYYLGIDGGATKTAFLLEDSNGNTLAFCELGSSNPNDVGIKECESVLRSGIHEVCSDVDKSLVAVFAGISGGGLSGNNADIIKKILSGFGFGFVANGSDVENAIELCIGEKDGIAIIAGTGIIAFAQKGGKRIRCGGWGYLIDSAGSGYNLGRDALEAALRSIDQRDGDTLITKLLEERLGTTIPDAIPTIYNGGKRFVACLATCVFDAAKQGDSTAKNILKRNCAYIADMIECLIKNFESTTVPVVICGGLAHEKDLLGEYIKSALSTKINLQFNNDPMVKGAISSAKKLSQNSSLCEKG